jgi:DNA-binding XRE family transcriptional regulator
MAGKVRTRGDIPGPDRIIPKPFGRIELKEQTMVLIPVEEWERVVETLQDYFDALEVQEMMEDPSTRFIPWEEARKKHLANRIKLVRKRKKITQKALAKRLNVSQARISQLEDPEYRPSMRVYKRVAKVLDCPVEALM